MSKIPQHDPNILVQAFEEMQQEIQNKSFNIVNQIGQICQSVMWGDKNNDIYFDYFCDMKTMQIFGELIECGNRDVVVAVIKCITMLLQNISRPISMNYLLSNASLNHLIIAEYNFKDDEIIAYYINLLKCVSIRIDEQSLQLFYNLKFSTFPMLMRAISFYKHKENLIRTSVRNIVLGITKIQQPQLRRYVSAFPFALFYVQFSCYMRDALTYINALIQDDRQESYKIIKLLLDDQLDILYFLEDLMKTNQDVLSIIINAILAYGFIPTIITGIYGQINFEQNARYQSMHHQQQRQHQRTYSLGNQPYQYQSFQHHNHALDIKLCLFILIQIYKSFSFSQFLDIITLYILGQTTDIQNFIKQINSDAKLHSYEKDVSMSEIWNLREKVFIQSYSQYIFKDCQLNQNININDKDELINAMASYQNDTIKYDLRCQHFKGFFNDSSKYEDFCRITEILGIQQVQSTKHKFTPLSYQSDNSKPSTTQGKTPFHSLMKHLENEDDTIVFMLLLFIKTMRHSKNISHNILQQVGMITPDKNLELYKQCNETRYYMQDKLLSVMETGLPPYRLGTYILSMQLFLDFCRQDLENYELRYRDRFCKLVQKQIMKIETYLINSVDCHYVIDFFYTDYKVLKKTSINIWPQLHIQLLNKMTQKGVCQIDVKHSESIYFMEPVTQQDQIRKDLLILQILKYAVSIFFQFTKEQQEILDQDKPLGDSTELKYKIGQIYNLNLEEYHNVKQYLCKYNYTHNDCCILEDSHFLVIMDLEQGTQDAKCLVCLNLKYTDEIIEKTNSKILHITYLKENKQTFDLEFKSRQEGGDAKNMIEIKKNQRKKNEQAIIQKYLIVLKNILNYQ